MIIHCLSCGKSISSHGHNCPYCFSEVSELTFELNGIEERPKITANIFERVLGLVQRSS